MSTLLPRPGIMDITPYIAGESAIDGAQRVIKLASNEGAFGPSPKVIAACRDETASIHRYPDGGCTRLRQAISARFGLDGARIVCGAGSDEILGLLCRAYAGPGDEILYSEHGFLMYPIAARTVGATPIAVPDLDLTADIDAIIDHVSDRTKIVFLANPNNPTGTYLDADTLQRLRRELPDNVLLVIDAAYAEFVKRNDYSIGNELVDAGENVVVTRTFSKLYALASLRLGWGYCPPAIADVLNRLRNPFNVTAMAQVAGIAALGDGAFEEKVCAHNETWREWTADQVRAMGFQSPPSHGNFILVRFGGDDPVAQADAADASLKKQHIIVRCMGGYGLGDSLRVTIGNEEEMRAFVDALKTFKEQAGV